MHCTRVMWHCSSVVSRVQKIPVFFKKSPTHWVLLCFGLYWVFRIFLLQLVSLLVDLAYWIKFAAVFLLFFYGFYPKTWWVFMGITRVSEPWLSQVCWLKCRAKHVIMSVKTELWCLYLVNDCVCVCQTLSCNPIASLDHFQPEMLGTAELVEEVPTGDSKVVKVTAACCMLLLARVDRFKSMGFKSLI